MSRMSMSSDIRYCFSIYTHLFSLADSTEKFPPYGNNIDTVAASRDFGDDNPAMLN